jgi:hypothetical protein
MRANLLWLVALLAAVGVAAGYYRSEPQTQQQHILSLRLLLSNRPLKNSRLLEGDRFRMDISRQSNGTAQMNTSQTLSGSAGTVSTISAGDWAEFEKGLLALPGWREKDCDGGEPESQVLYTLLEIETEQGQFVSHWRGLPRPQAEVANFLLASRVGGPLGQGLARLQPLQQGAQTPVGSGVARQPGQ